MYVRKQVKTLLKILPEAPFQQKHLGADRKHFQILKLQSKRKSENKSCENDKNGNTNQCPLFPLKTFLMIFRGARNISLAAGVIPTTGYLAAWMSAVLSSCNKTSTASARSDINSHLSAKAGDGLPVEGTELAAGGSQCGMGHLATQQHLGEKRGVRSCRGPLHHGPLRRGPWPPACLQLVMPLAPLCPPCPA